MKRPVVRWSDAAYADLSEIVDFIQYDRPEAGLRVARAILAAVASLSKQPMRGRVVPELLDQGVSMYGQLLVQNYRVIYEVRPDAILLHMVVDCRRNLPEILMRRLLR